MPGHGLATAVGMGGVRSALRAYALTTEDPAHALTQLDRKVHHFEAGALTTEPTTLQRLAAAMDLPVEQARQAVLELGHIGSQVAHRTTDVVSVDELRVHSRFTLSPM
ncbi:SpoIIE family protein phosphatase [Actinoplanes sp. NEAU-A12]|uniref:SpoIIE family protein phosphatase n=1 Tax=Actinoplanes sandaracinus TaxID=3045177 RepID=A0ABT6X0B1_9ACTN|nr:SpoIIE family protein phosphatase [Actinoplanes sandaracinus]MDI6105445.1 SpoIIE family protein phosphatase [Actinoplanes sandaracinus]